MHWTFVVWPFKFETPCTLLEINVKRTQVYRDEALENVYFSNIYNVTVSNSSNLFSVALQFLYLSFKTKN